MKQSKKLCQIGYDVDYNYDNDELLDNIFDNEYELKNYLIDLTDDDNFGEYNIEKVIIIK